MSIPKQHHYVPRCFFKPWENSSKQLFVYERKNGVILRPFRQSTKSICVEKGLYSYTSKVAEPNRHVIETKLLSSIDGNAEKVLRQLYHLDGEVKLTDQDRYYFAVFINSLRMRTPEAFQSNTLSAEKILREKLLENDPRLQEELVMKALKGQNLIEWTSKHNPALIENFGHELMASFFIDDKFVNRILAMSWLVIKRWSSDSNFLSSDRPLFLLGSEKSFNVTLAIAISPDRLFVATSHPDTIRDMLKVSPKEFIRRANVSTIQQAKYKAFSIDKRHSPRFFENKLGKRHDILPWTIADP